MWMWRYNGKSAGQYANTIPLKWTLQIVHVSLIGSYDSST